MILSNPYGKSKKGSPFFARAGPRKSGVRALQNKKSYGIMWKNASQKKGAMDLQAREKIEYALEQIRKGQDEGVETLYVLMGRTMLFVANGVVRDRHAAEDVVQESFVKISRESTAIARAATAMRGCAGSCATPLSTTCASRAGRRNGRCAVPSARRRTFSSKTCP